MDNKVALIIALTARLEQFFHSIPSESPATRAAVLKYSAYLIDHCKPQAMLAGAQKVKDESSIQFLVRNIDRIRMLPEYRWPSYAGAAQLIPQVAFATTAAAQEILRGKKLAPGDVLELISWLEPVWEPNPTLKEPTFDLIRAAANT